MSNLIPEKRLDKNGVLTTKHVRATPKVNASSSLLGAAPKASSSASQAKSYKAPTKGQQKPKPRVFTASLEHRDAALLESLEIASDLGIYRFKASDEEFYDVLSVASRGNTLAFLNAGIKTADDAAGYLLDNNLESLLEDNRDVSMEARERRIPIEAFLRNTGQAEADDFANPRYWDALQVDSTPGLSSCIGLSKKVYEGKINFDDIKAVGVARISNSVGWFITEEALEKLARGEAKYTPEDLKKVLEKYGDQSDSYMENSLDLCEQYGSEFGTSLRQPSHASRTVNDELTAHGETPERAMSILKYLDDIETEGFIRDAAFEVNTVNLTRFNDANVSPSDAYHGRVTLHQLDAIEEHGISSSMSSGWL